MKNAIEITEWTFAGKESEFPQGKPIRKIVMGRPLVFLRTENQFLSFDDYCPHRGYPLSEGKCRKLEAGGLRLQCAYHGWEFDEAGVLKKRPGLSEGQAPALPLTGYQTVLRGSFLFVRSLSAGTDIPIWLEEIADPKMDIFYFEKSVRANRLHVMENLLDPFHTHYIHAPFLRADSKRGPVKVVATYRSAEQTLELEYLNEPTPSGWISRLFEPQRLKTLGRYHHSGAAVLEYWTKRGLDLRVTLFVAEEGSQNSRAQLFFQTRKTRIPFLLKKAFFRFFTGLLVEQDFVALQTQAENLNHFPEKGFVFSSEDLILKVMTQLSAGKFVEDFRKSYEISI